MVEKPRWAKWPHSAISYEVIRNTEATSTISCSLHCITRRSAVSITILHLKFTETKVLLSSCRSAQAMLISHNRLWINLHEGFGALLACSRWKYCACTTLSDVYANTNSLPVKHRCLCLLLMLPDNSKMPWRLTLFITIAQVLQYISEAQEQISVKLVNNSSYFMFPNDTNCYWSTQHLGWHNVFHNLL